MFLMVGVTQGEKEIPYNRTMTCDNCGAWGRYRVFMTYMCLSLFFIPVFKWNRRYYAQSTCCGTVYELNPDIGRGLAAGEDIEIVPDDLYLVQSGRGRYKRCSSCGYTTQEDFDYCPKCGQRM